MTLTQGHSCGIDKHKFACLQDKVRTTQPITTKLGSYTPLVMLITWLDFRGILVETVILANFLWKFRMCFFKVKHSFGHISGMVGSINVKRKGVALVGYWVNYLTLTFDLTPDLDLSFSKVKCQNSCFSGIVIWLMWNKKKANQLDNGLTVWSCPLTHPWPWTCSFKVKVWNSLIWGMGGLIDMEWKGCELIIHDLDSDLAGNHVGGVGGCTG